MLVDNRQLAVSGRPTTPSLLRVTLMHLPQRKLTILNCGVRGRVRWRRPIYRLRKSTMKLAYFIAAHRLERQFEWLFRAVWNPDDVFVVHLSKSTPNECIREVHRMA